MKKRDIKLRVYENGKMLYPAEGKEYGNVILWSGYERQPRTLRSKNAIFMQMTGHTDVDGYHVYEGDILQSKMLMGYVVWSDEYSSFMYQELATNPQHREKKQVHLWMVLADDTKLAKVVGNIYQNPELISEEGVNKFVESYKKEFRWK